MPEAILTASQLSVEHRQQLEHWLTEFDRNWKRGLCREYSATLPGELELYAHVCLLELAKIDLERNWNDGTPHTVEEYLTEFPVLGSAETVSIELLETEYEVRTLAGEKDAFEKIVARFPRQTKELQSRLKQGDSNRTVARDVAGSRDTRKGQADTHSVPPRVTRQPTPTVISPLEQTAQAGSVAEQFGRYRIERQLGAGAMGAVYLAHDTQLDRQVALKTPSFTGDDSGDMVQRFYREARTAATLRHTNICPVFDVGEIDGVHFITMAFIDGRPLSDFIKPDNAIPERAVATTIRKLALGLQHAHESGVIHRDLKPANIMVDRQKEPIIMDFGIARKLESSKESRITQQGLVLGTPAYMSPEQAEGAEDLGPASDQYSLGVIFFELLTGQLPADGNISAILAQKLTKSAPSPLTLRPDLDPRLAAICERMTSRKVEDRYASLKDVADDVKRALLDKAPPPAAKQRKAGTPSSSSTETVGLPATEPQKSGSRARPKRSLKRWFAGLPPLGKSAVAAGFLGLVGLTAFAIVFIVRTPDGGTLRIEVDDPNLEITLDGETLTLADKTWEGKKKNKKHWLAVKVGGKHLKIGSPTVVKLPDGRTVTHKLTLKLDGVELRSDQFEITRGKTTVVEITYEKKVTEGKKVAESDGAKEKGVVTKPPTKKGTPDSSHTRLGIGDQLFILEGHKSSVLDVAFSPDGKRLVSASSDTINVWKVATGERVRSWPGKGLRAMAYAPNGRWIVSGGEDNTAVIRNAETGEIINTLRGHSRWVWSIAVSPDSRQIVTGSADGTAILWNTETGEKIHTLGNYQSEVRAVDFSPDGRQIVTASSDNGNRACLWDAATGKIIRRFDSLTSHVRDLAFSRVRPRVAAPQGSEIVILDSETGKMTRELKSHNSQTNRIEFSRDGKRIVAVLPNRTAIVLDAESGAIQQTLNGHTSSVADATFSPDGRQIATAAGRTTILWRAKPIGGQPPPKKAKPTGSDDAPARLVLRGHRRAVKSVSFSPDGRQVLTGSDDGTTLLWNADTGKTVRTFRMGARAAVRMSPDGRSIAGTTYSGVLMWDAESGKKIQQFNGHKKEVLALEFSPNGRYLLTGSKDATARLWDVKSGECIRTLERHKGYVNGVDFSPDGSHAVTSSNDRTAIIWNLSTGKVVRILRAGHKWAVEAAVYSRDGKHIITGARPSIFLWNAMTGDLVRSWRAHYGEVNGLAVSPDGRLLASVTSNAERTCKIWDLQNGLLIQTLRGPSEALYNVAFSPDGRRVVASSHDETATIWTIKQPTPAPPATPVTGKLIQTLRGHEGPVQSVVVSKTGDLFVTGSDDKTVRLWDAKTGTSRRVLRHHTASVTGVALSPDGSRIVSASKDGVTYLIRRETGEKQFTWRDDGAVSAVAFSPNEEYVITITNRTSHRGTMWNSETGEKRFNFRFPFGFRSNHWVHSVGYSPNGFRIAAGVGNKVVMWSKFYYEVQGQYEKHTADVLAAAFSPDSARLVSGSEDNTAIIWNEASGEVLHILKGHTGPVNAVAFSPDGHTVVTASREDKTVKVWHTATGKLLGTIGDKTTGVNSVAFLPDGSGVLLGQDDNTATVWRIQPVTAEEPRQR